MYPDGKDALDTTLSDAPSETYDDKPKFSHWADKKAQARPHLPDLDQAAARSGTSPSSPRAAS